MTRVSLSTADAARILCVSPRTVTRLVSEGRLAALDRAPGPRGALLFERHAVEALAAERAGVTS